MSVKGNFSSRLCYKQCHSAGPWAKWELMMYVLRYSMLQTFYPLTVR